MHIYMCVCVMHVGLSLSMMALPKPCLAQLGDHMVLVRILSLTSHAFAERPESGAAAAGLGALTGVSTGLEEVSFRDLPRLLTAGGS
jgi:hypothetical protein